MPDIYEQHSAAFANVSAFVIAKDGSRVATIAFKSPRDGAGRLYAYVHWLGMPMVRGFAGGCGYDKRSAACSSAADKLPAAWTQHVKEWRELGMSREISDDMPDDVAAFRDALRRDDGSGWDSRLRAAGFEVWLAV